MTAVAIMVSGKRAMVTPQIGGSRKCGRTLVGYVDHNRLRDIFVLFGDPFESFHACVF